MLHVLLWLTQHTLASVQQEYSLEQTLDKMQGDWSGVCFDHMAWRSTGTHILRGLDDIQMLLDDQIIKTQSMRASPYIGPFEDRVRSWEAKLNMTQVRADDNKGKGMVLGHAGLSFVSVHVPGCAAQATAHCKVPSETLLLHITTVCVG